MCLQISKMIGRERGANNPINFRWLVFKDTILVLNFEIDIDLRNKLLHIIN